jgi:hypothetical protein
MNNHVIMHNLGRYHTEVWTDKSHDPRATGFEDNSEQCLRDYRLHFFTTTASWILAVVLIVFGIHLLPDQHAITNVEKSWFGILTALFLLFVVISLQVRTDSLTIKIARDWKKIRSKLFELWVIHHLTELYHCKHYEEIPSKKIKELLVSAFDLAMQELLLDFQRAKRGEFVFKRNKIIRKIKQAKELVERLGLKMTFHQLDKLGILGK